jgi:putative transposase
MGRPHRDLVAGGYYHVGSRGNNHAPIVVDREDRMVFFHLLRRVERRYGWRIHVSCLMGNHYHLVLETPAPNLDKGMRDLNGGYARAFNDRHGRKDHVFGRRYWSKSIESEEQYEATLEYVLHNPVHHGFVGRREDWNWASAPIVRPIDSPGVTRHRQADSPAVARRLSDGGAAAADRPRR